MSDRRQRSLIAVRMVRERVEEREERTLGEVSREMQRAREMAERLQGELETIREAAVKSVDVLISGLEIQQRAAEFDALQRQRTEAEDELERLEARRLEHMQSYRVAHAEREAIEELQEQRKVVDANALLARERKDSDELFLGRRMFLRQRPEREMRER